MFVLVVTRHAATGELVRQTLGAEGWWVTAVADRETAVRSASDQAPELVVIDDSVDEAAELVRFFASRHGGPGALLLAVDDEVEAAIADDADAVLPREPEVEELAATAQRLLERPQASPAAALPTPGRVLNAQDIFGDMLAEMGDGEDPAGPPSSPAPGADDTVVTTVDFPLADQEPIVESLATAPVSPAVVETRPMVIPEPTMDAVEEDTDFTLPAFDDAMVTDDLEAAVGLETDLAEPGERAAPGVMEAGVMETVPVIASPVVEERGDAAGRPEPATAEEGPEPEPVSGEEPVTVAPVAAAVTPTPTFGQRLMTIARRMSAAAGTAAAPAVETAPEAEPAPEPVVTAQPEAPLGTVTEPEPRPEPEVEAAPILERVTEPETAPDETAPEQAKLAEEPAAPEEASAEEDAAPEEAAPEEAVPEVAAPEEAAPEVVAPEVVAPEVAAPGMAAPGMAAAEVAAPGMAAPGMAALEAAVAEEAFPDEAVASEEAATPELPAAFEEVALPETHTAPTEEPPGHEEPVPEVVSEEEEAPQPQGEREPDPVPSSEQAALPLPGALPAATPLWRRGSLPGGTSFWVGMAAGLLVFVLASFLLDRYFSPAPPEQPAAVTVPAVPAVDLEELVDQELAQREAELRESLLEEERRLQQQLDDLTAGDDGG